MGLRTRSAVGRIITCTLLIHLVSYADDISDLPAIFGCLIRTFRGKDTRRFRDGMLFGLASDRLCSVRGVSTSKIFRGAEF